MKRILYLMHVPWAWIKQRPHFFAEYLSEDFIVDVYYKKSILASGNNLLENESNKANLSIKGFRQIAFDKIPLLKYLNLNFINKIILNYQLPDFAKYDYIWFTCPSMYLLFSYKLKDSNIIVYDCMDDIHEFPFCKKNRFLDMKLLDAEKKLLDRAKVVFCSAEYLKNKILQRSKLHRNIIVLNNAIELPVLSDINAFNRNDIYMDNLFSDNNRTLLYIGTISEWFDFDLVLKILEKYKQINLVLVGPSDVNIPKHDHIYYLGTIERKYIFSLMEKSWCLIMPFKVNELIKSVNPVKLYEYIYMGKHVIAPKYNETIKFEKFVNLYASEADLVSIIERIIGINELTNGEKKQMRSFSENNTWLDRYQVIRNELMLL